MTGLSGAPALLPDTGAVATRHMAWSGMEEEEGEENLQHKLKLATLIMV